jgi:DNA mismatch endonuclease (patch repair protein)
MDTVDRQTRSRIMASVGQKNTGAEMILRRALHANGFRYRLHVRHLPGSPDLVFPRFRAAVFVHGCYWHAHGCYRSTVPKSRKNFWTEKFDANRRRDAAKAAALRDLDWRVLTVWECALKGKTALPLPNVVDLIADWLRSEDKAAEISGRPPATREAQ